MDDGLTGFQKFWCSACIVWLVLIFVTYRDHFRSLAWSPVIIAFVGFFPIVYFVIFVARRKCRESHQYRSNNSTDHSLPVPILTQNMVAVGLIPPEPREPPHGSLLRNCSLVTYVYRKEGKSEADDCAVCLGQLQEGESVAKLQFCSHLFHEKCIDPWLRQHKTCPICRSRVDRKVSAESTV